ncbi:flagellar hook-length control protein FliK [Timonella sp. A28]|uniref:flagellar hook-length control protein FliK n=1 Tax=Timonella sp. A28 TaxID=3442640 RepID=UPI003EBBB147
MNSLPPAPAMSGSTSTSRPQHGKPVSGVTFDAVLDAHTTQHTDGSEQPATQTTQGSGEETSGTAEEKFNADLHDEGTTDSDNTEEALMNVVFPGVANLPVVDEAAHTLMSEAGQPATGRATASPASVGAVPAHNVGTAPHAPVALPITGEVAAEAVPSSQLAQQATTAQGGQVLSSSPAHVAAALTLVEGKGQTTTTGEATGTTTALGNQPITGSPQGVGAPTAPVSSSHTQPVQLPQHTAGTQATAETETARTVAATSSASAETATQPTTENLRPHALENAATQRTVTPAAPSERVQVSAPAQTFEPLTQQLKAPLAALRNASAGEHTFTVRVTPENLGPVQVRAHVSHDSVRVELIGATELVRDSLRAILTDLKRDMHSQGMTTQLSVSNTTSNSSTSDFARQDSNPGFTGHNNSSRNGTHSANTPTAGAPEQVAPASHPTDRTGVRSVDVLA